MEANVGESVEAGVGKIVESDSRGPARSEPALRLRLLGPMTVRRAGEPLVLPASRKARALLAYLALSSRPVTRSRLCELLWEMPDDPRGELRWCLSKLRRVLDEPHRRRVDARDDTVALDLSDCCVDAIEIARATQEGIASLDVERLLALSQLFAGELLEGLELDGNAQFGAWLITERHRFRGRNVAIIECLAKRSTGAESLEHVRKWLALAPFDRQAHEALLAQLARSGLIVEGEEHLAAAAKLFEAEGLDPAPIRAAWRAAKRQTANSSPIPTIQSAEPAVDDERMQIAGTSRRASVAVMPFVARTGDPGGCPDGLVHDVITRLAKLRSVFVIAQGTVFALREQSVAPEEAARLLNVDYIVTGAVQRRGSSLRVAVELAETRTARIVWSEVFDHRVDDTFLVLDEVGGRIVASIAGEIEINERNRAVLKPPSSLDAWEAYHRGLWHMYRFDQADNERARHFFEMAVRLDPTFARAHAGLSFTHFQNAFQGWARGDGEIDQAYETAGCSLMADDRDPAAHWAMGRALWLRGLQDQSVVELQRAVDLSPNFASGHYSLAFVTSQAGDPRAAIESADHSRRLSPCDPMMYAMLAARAMALVRLRRFEEAAEWAVMAAARPNAHPHVHAVAAYALALAGSLAAARARSASIHKVLPNYGLADFLNAFKYDADGTALFQKAAGLIGMT